MAAIWADIDAGKTHHHCVAIQERAASGRCRDASPTTSPNCSNFSQTAGAWATK
ncbi:hypothetical protein ABZ468_30675 [Streptomyces sp. NPDC005708]|uniref:hypothetical protein n=1 Tax=unclassified Streptomyces TaxID=2593676 RepID=UPI0033C4432D